MLAVDQPVRYVRYSSEGGWLPVDARVITEAAVSLTVNGQNWLTFNCTPSSLDALAAGFLFNEGIISTGSEIAAIDVCQQGTNIDVWLNHPVKRPEQWQRTSGCNGGVTAGGAEVQPQTVTLNLFSAQAVLAGMEQLLHVQELYREARGVHCSGVSNGQAIIAQAEDIGRHNTLDKLAGRMLLDGISVPRGMVLTTGRVSSEMLQKSARLGASLVVSRTSPTSQSVLLAEQLGITLIGYARRNQFLVYSHPEQIQPENR